MNDFHLHAACVYNVLDNAAMNIYSIVLATKLLLRRMTGYWFYSMRAGLPILLVLGFHYQQSHKLHQLSRPTVLSSKEHCSHSVLPSLIIVTSSRSWQNRKKFNQCSVRWTEWFTRKWCFNTTGALFSLSSLDC